MKAEMNVACYRVEEDSIGQKKVPLKAYYGVQSLRAVENFPISGEKMNRAFICSMAEIKKACARANAAAGVLTAVESDAISEACDEVLSGKLDGEFIVDPVQGSAGTSMNMNINEVVANRAEEILGGSKGAYKMIHPNDHVNQGQSTNDVIPTAGKMTVLKLWGGLKAELTRLHKALVKKAEEFDDVIKMGRTQLQDAVPIRLGSEFAAYAQAVERGIKRCELVMDEMNAVNLGGSAVGTGLNADKKYAELVIPELSKVSGLPLQRANDLVDGTQNLDSFSAVMGSLKALAVSLSKMSNDLRLLSSGPKCGLSEINLPARQNGSSIMPGKVNPVIPEVMNQVCFYVFGADQTVALACEAGQMELNAFEPIVYYSIFKSMEMLKNGVATLTRNCVEGITANKEHCRDLVEHSIGIITAICPKTGYKRAAKIAKESLKTGVSVKELVVAQGLMSEKEAEEVLDPMKMV